VRQFILLVCCAVLNCCDESQPSDWLEGRWAVDGQACNAAWLTYRGDGTWSDEGQEGSWVRDGMSLRTSFTRYGEVWPHHRVHPVQRPLCHTERLQRIGEGELRTTWEDNTTHRLIRCHPTQIIYPHIGCLGDCDRVTPYDPSPWNIAPPAATRHC
jgi:hypothetical protein